MATGRHKVYAVSIADGKFVVDKKLGAGCFGEVWRGVNSETQQEVAVKFEDSSSSARQLRHEASVLIALRSPTLQQGFAEYHHFGKEGPWNCLVMEHLGKSLEDRVQQCGGKFSVKTTLLLADQILQRIEYLHSKGVVHRDIKPENFLLGVGEKQHHLYLIDFGLSKRYYDRRHALMRTRLSLTGTARYASINAHRGVEQSRRDDLEAIGHMLLYFLLGALPWSGLAARSKQEKYHKIMQKKESVKLSDLCRGYPGAFESYLRYCRSLGFKDRPDYGMLRGLIHDARAPLEKERGRPLQDHEFEWNEDKELGVLVPLAAATDIVQPDDHEVKSRPRGLRCFCGVKGSSNC